MKIYVFWGMRRPDVKFFCDLDYDPFLIMQDQNKMYGKYPWLFSICIWNWPKKLGFTVSLYEYEATIPTLWKTVKGLQNLILKLSFPDGPIFRIHTDASRPHRTR